MIFIITNPLLRFRRSEIKEACTVIDSTLTAGSVFAAIACQVSLGDPYHCDFDAWSHYEIIWHEMTDESSVSLKNTWINFACEVHATGFSMIWDNYPDDVSDLVKWEEDSLGYLVGEYYHPSGEECSTIDDVIIVIKIDPEYAR